MIVKSTSKWPLILFCVVLLLAFFLPWLNWTGSGVTGYDFPAGNFFKLSENKFDLANPFPEFDFINYVFWLVPGLALVSIVLLILHRTAGWIPAMTAVLALSLVMVYILFTQTVIEQVGLVKSLPGAFRPALYATIVAATGIIIAGLPRKPLLKAAFLVIGPLCTWFVFQFMSGQVLKSHDDTADVKSAYTVNGLEMIREFQENTNMANSKYKEQIVTVNGRASAIELINDSTVNVKMIDTTGAYAIFSFEKKDVAEAKKIAEGDSVSIKASCSGGEYSNILGVTYIPFKRSVIKKL